MHLEERCKGRFVSGLTTMDYGQIQGWLLLGSILIYDTRFSLEKFTELAKEESSNMVCVPQAGCEHN